MILRLFFLFALHFIIFEPCAQELDVIINAQKFSYQDNEQKTIVAEGNVEVLYQNIKLLADQIIYNQATDQIIAKGNIKYQDNTQYVITADEIILNDKLKNIILQHLEIKMLSRGYIKAERVLAVNDDVITVENGFYTACKFNCKTQKPFWHISAKNIEYNKKKNIVSYKHSILKMGNVPIFYTPFFSHASPNVKGKSGFLMPILSNNTYVGKSIVMPFYYYLSNNSDITLFPRFSTNNNLTLALEYRKVFNDGWKKLHASYTRDNNYLKNKNRGHFYLSSKLKSYNNWYADIDLKLSSDKDYLNQYYYKQIKYLEENFLTSKISVKKKLGNSHHKVEFLYFQNLGSDKNMSDTPVIFPNYSMVYNFLETKVAKNYAKIDFLHLIKDYQNKRNNRFIFELGTKIPYRFDNGLNSNFEASIRSDYYSYRKEKEETRIITRFIPKIHFQLRYPLIKHFNKYNSLLFEPIINTVIRPKHNYNYNIDNEDSQLSELNPENLFLDSRYSGYDIIEPGTSISYAMKMNYINHLNYNIMFLFGQSYSKNIELKQLNTLGSQKFSDYVGNFSAIVKDHINFSYKFVLNKTNLSPKKHLFILNKKAKQYEFDIEYTSFDDDVYYINNVKNQKELMLQTKFFYNNWTPAIYSVLNLTSKKDDLSLLNNDKNRLIKLGTSLRYSNECTDYLIKFERDYTKLVDNKPSNSWWINLSLKNLF